MSFVHLHVHSQYSLLEASCDPSDLALRAKELGMPALALTDNGNMFGAIEFYFAALKNNIKPILGLDAYLAPQSRHNKSQESKELYGPDRRIVLLAQDIKGYQNLCQVSTIGYQEGFYYKPRIDDEILQKYSENLIALSGGWMGDIPFLFRRYGKDKAFERIQFYKKIYGDRFYLELNRTGLKEWSDINSFLLEAGEKLSLKTVATNDVHYLAKGDHVGQEVLICIGTNKTLQDPSRFRLGSEEFYLKSPEEMRSLFSDLPASCDNTLEIADRVNIQFKLKHDDGKPIYHLPTLPTENGRSLEEEIERLAFEGLEKRYQELKLQGDPVLDEDKPQYTERLRYELKTIAQMGFTSYFLIVQDFIRWSKQNNIPVGPGRGSGAGSLVAYSLGITDLNPIPYNLIFERFLNPERISMPDFDIDFCQENRHRVIDYVTQKYGAASVSQIITYGKLQARAAIRDVGRVMGMTYGEVDVVSKLMPEKLNLTIKEALELEPRLREMMEDEPRIATLMNLAQKIEGITRHAGIHAAGVIIADGALVEHAPLYRGVDGENVVQYDMKHAEKIGLIKFDFLGLKTLTHIQDTLRLIAQNFKDSKGEPLQLSTTQISLKDPGIYSLMSKGDTAGVFQFEGEGITDTLRKVLPNCFEDIVAVNALYRPGPMDMIPDYIDRKHGRKPVEYIFAELEEILKETYGIIVYQEQVQLIAARIAGYSLGEADVLRRAMGKKDAQEMARQKERFIAGAQKNKFDQKKSEELFDLMAKFAEYGFNKSHAAAYCVIAAHTAYLKNYYPVEFYSALLSTEMNDTDKVVKYIKDARRHNIAVKPPHINYSDFKFNAKEGSIYFSLGAIKGVGESAVKAILEAREKQPQKIFESLEDFFSVIDLRRVNKKTLECLIKAGALDGFGFNRAELFNGYARFIERLESQRKDAELGQSSLFDLSSDDDEKVEKVLLDRYEDWSRALRLSYEKEVLGFFLSGHPLDGLDQVLQTLTSHKLNEINGLEPQSKISLLALVSSVREIITKKGTRMAFLQIEDSTGSAELIAFPDTYAQSELFLKSDGPLLIQATTDKNTERNGNQPAKLILEKVQEVDSVLKQAKKIILRLESGVSSASDRSSESSSEVELQGKLALLKEILLKHPGESQFSIQLQLAEMNRSVELQVKEPRGVEMSHDLLNKIAGLIESPKVIIL